MTPALLELLDSLPGEGEPEADGEFAGLASVSAEDLYLLVGNDDEERLP